MAPIPGEAHFDGNRLSSDGCCPWMYMTRAPTHKHVHVTAHGTIHERINAQVAFLLVDFQAGHNGGSKLCLVD